MSEEKKNTAPIDFSHPSIGGRKVGHWVPVNLGKEIDFSSIPGVRCVMSPPLRAKSDPPTDAAPDAPEDEAGSEPQVGAPK